MRQEKTQMVNYIGGLLDKSSYVFFVNYKGLNVRDFSEFRTILATNEADCHVLKNRLIKKAVELGGHDTLADFELKGDTAMISGSGDAGAVAKVIDNFFKAHSGLVAKGGCMEGVFLSEADVKSIASLPSKEALQSQLLGVLQAPARDLASILNIKLTEIVNVLSAYEKKLEA